MSDIKLFGYLDNLLNGFIGLPSWAKIMILTFVVIILVWIIMRRRY